MEIIGTSMTSYHEATKEEFNKHFDLLRKRLKEHPRKPKFTGKETLDQKRDLIFNFIQCLTTTDLAIHQIIEQKTTMFFVDGVFIAMPIDDGLGIMEIIFSDLLKENVMSRSLSVFQDPNTYKFGFKDENGRISIQPTYENCKEFSEGLAACRLNGKWGFIDELGSVQIPFKYFEVSKFSQGLAGARLHDAWGFINKSDKLVIGYKYEYILNDFQVVAGVREPAAVVGLMTKKHQSRCTHILINREGKVLDDDL